MKIFNRPCTAIVLIAGSVLFMSRDALAAVEVVNGFGVNGWTSWDTRNTSGTQLVGTNDTNSYGASYFGVTPSTADDAAIQQQIAFMGEGQTVNDAAGSTPPASPTGSLNGLGYVRLDGTSSNSGKSDISYVNKSGIAPAADLISPTFSTTYSFYPVYGGIYISREPGLNISVIGTDSKQYTFSYTPTPYNNNAWNTETADSLTSQYSLYISGGPGNVGSNTMAGWLASSYGPEIFGTGAEVWRVGFNVGSSQHDGLDYVDYVQSSILNGGDVIDFQQVPEPASFSLLGVGALALLRRKRRA